MLRAQAPYIPSRVQGAQGTIEYLVIIAVVVVIALVVVGLLNSQLGAGSNIAVASSEIGNKTGIGGISVVDAVASGDANGLLVLKNTGPETLTINKINVDGVDHNYSAPIAMGGQTGFRLQGIVSCDGTNQTYTVKIYYTSASGLDKSADFETITVDCTGTVVSSGSVVDEDNGGNVPVVPPACDDSLEFHGGDGSAGNPYQICSWTQLNNMRSHLTSSFVLMNNLGLGDANYGDYAGPGANFGAGWNPVGDCGPNMECGDDTPNYGYTFRGSFDGGGHSIIGLRISRPSSQYVGLFGYVMGYGMPDAAIQNIYLIDANINGSSQTGGLVGYLSYAPISNVTLIDVNVSGASQIGGLVGFSSYSAIINTHSNGIVSGLNDVGGIVGNMFHGSVANSHSMGGVTGANRVGGIIGNNQEGGISKSYSTASVAGTQYGFGGLVGKNFYGSIGNSYARGNVSGFQEVGGLVGRNQGPVFNSYSTGSITGAGSFGGLVGSSPGGGSVASSFYDTTNSGRSDNDGRGAPKTSLQMKYNYNSENTFGAWSFDINWSHDTTASINEGYPILTWQTQ